MRLLIDFVALQSKVISQDGKKLRIYKIKHLTLALEKEKIIKMISIELQPYAQNK